MPIMLMNWQPVLGRGCSHEEDRPQNMLPKDDPMHLNLLLHPEESRFLAFAALKETYQEDEEVLPDALEFLALDLRKALQDGICLDNGYKVRLAVVSIKGDWPWLITAGNLLRHFRRAPTLVCIFAFAIDLRDKNIFAIDIIHRSLIYMFRQQQLRKKGQSQCHALGVCHMCLAGQEGFPFTDCGECPRFLPTLTGAAAAVCWDVPSALTRFLPQMPGNLPQFYRPDMWHAWHLGAGRYFLSSAIVLLMPLYPGSNVPDKFDAMTARWRQYCQDRKRRPILQRISSATVNYGPLDWPEGNWQKADTTTLLCDSWNSTSGRVGHYQFFS